MWNDASGVGWGAGMIPVVWRGSWNDLSGLVGELHCYKISRNFTLHVTDDAIAKLHVAKILANIFSLNDE